MCLVDREGIAYLDNYLYNPESFPRYSYRLNGLYEVHTTNLLAHDQLGHGYKAVFIIDLSCVVSREWLVCPRISFYTWFLSNEQWIISLLYFFTLIVAECN